jgi:hypothetical protein
VVLEEGVVVAVLLEGPVEVVVVIEEELVLVELLDVDEEPLIEYVVVLPCQATTPSLAYKLNCLDPPHFAVPVVAAPIEPLQTSVQAFAPVKLVTEEEPKLKTLPP